MNQGLNGDLTELQPDGSASLEEQYRWIEWKSYFGTPQNQARLEFLQIVEPMFEEIGVNTEDPLKEPTEEAFEECQIYNTNAKDENVKRQREYDSAVSAQAIAKAEFEAEQAKAALAA